MKRYAAAIGFLLLVSCSTQPEAKKEAAAPQPAAQPGAPAVYKVKFVTSKGPFVVEVHREWAPRGADRFYELVKDDFYNDARFFLCVPNFILQFRLAARPAIINQ